LVGLGYGHGVDGRGKTPISSVHRPPIPKSVKIHAGDEGLKNRDGGRNSDRERERSR
jgi:hypothetical protein